jgi:VWFA-related protein
VDKGLFTAGKRLVAPVLLAGWAMPLILLAQAGPTSLSMCIVIDTSGRMREKQNEVKAAVIAMVGAARPGDELCVVDSSDEAYVRADLTKDFDVVADSLKVIDARGGSALPDAIETSVNLIDQKARNRKVVVLITGTGDISRAASNQLREKIGSRGVLLYAMALGNERDKGKTSQGQSALRELAASAGGLYRAAETFDDIDKIAAEIERDARNK